MSLNTAERSAIMRDLLIDPTFAAHAKQACIDYMERLSALQQQQMAFERQFLALRTEIGSLVLDGIDPSGSMLYQGRKLRSTVEAHSLRVQAMHDQMRQALSEGIPLAFRSTLSEEDIEAIMSEIQTNTHMQYSYNVVVEPLKEKI